MTDPRTAGIPSVSSRRLAVSAGVAATCGLGLGWWRFIYSDNAEAVRAEREAGTAGEIDPIRQFWRASFDTPSGARLPLASFRGKPLLVNFWATWCPPCVEELPLIDAFYRQNKPNGWQVIGIAADQLAAVNTFLGKMPLGFPVALAGMAGVDLSKSLGNISGGLPFTVILGSDGTVRHRKIGRVTPEDLTAWSALK
jgi:thiol-disulfide isomerase/thioredoxin